MEPDAPATCADDGHTATILAPTGGTSPTELKIRVRWSAITPRRYLLVTDQDGNVFTTESAISPTSDELDASYVLPAGRTFTAEAGYLCESSGVRRALATATFATVATTACETRTVGYSVTITKPLPDAVLPAGVTDPNAAFAVTFTPSSEIPDKFREIYDETDHAPVFVRPGGYELAPGHTFTLTYGWYCLLDGSGDKRIPLAGLRFSTTP